MENSYGYLRSIFMDKYPWQKMEGNPHQKTWTLKVFFRETMKKFSKNLLCIKLRKLINFERIPEGISIRPAETFTNPNLAWTLVSFMQHDKLCWQLRSSNSAYRYGSPRFVCFERAQISFLLTTWDQHLITTTKLLWPSLCASDTALKIRQSNVFF